MTKVRPRLLEHALLRRHLVDGEERVVLHDARTGDLMLLDARALALCLAADGTRDVDGVALELSRQGLYRRHSQIEAVLARLDDAGLLHDGIQIAPPDTLEPDCALTPLSAERGKRAVATLPGYVFECSTRGGCCSQHATIAVTRNDLVRARRAGLSPLAEPDDAVLPLAGSVAGKRFALPLVDGACSERSSDGLCGLHARGGPDAKPIGCAIYPATYVDDGVEIRMSYGCECDCVFESLTPERAGSDAAEEARGDASAIASGVVIRELPPNVALTASSHAPREAVAAWSCAIAEVAPVDAVTGLLALAAVIESRGLDVVAARAALTLPAPSAPAEELTPLLEGLSQRAAAAARSADAWRSARDRTRQMRHAVSAAAERASSSSPARLTAATDIRLVVDERFVVRAALFGHHLVGGAPLEEGLRELAARLFIARVLGESELGHPIAVVMATLRGM